MQRGVRLVSNISHYDNMIYRLDTIKYLIGLGGIDHVMVGTDYPYDLGDCDAAKKVEQLDIPDADKLLMLEGNAKRREPGEPGVRLLFPDFLFRLL
jgi:hypothetical protein